MRCITSDPVPWLQRMGRRPAMMAATVIIFGRTRSTAPTAIYEVDDPAAAPRVLEAFRAEVHHFRESVLAGKAPCISVDEAVNDARWIEAIGRSYVASVPREILVPP